MSYRDLVMAQSPTSYWRLGTSLVAPPSGGVDAYDGLVFGQGPSFDGLQGDWQDWSWDSARDLHFETGSRNRPPQDSIDLTIGPYGAQWSPNTTAGTSDAGFQLYSDAGVDWAAQGYTHLNFSMKWDGSGPLPDVKIYLNFGGLGATVDVTAGGADIYPFPKNGQQMWRYDVTLSGAATLGSLGSFGLTAGSVINALIWQVNGLSPTSPFYIDEIQFVRTKAAFNVYGIAGVGAENAQTYNWVPNHMVLLNKPAPPSWSEWDIPPLNGFWNAIDGNWTADDTVTVLRIAARKWGFASTGPIVRLGADNGAALNIPDLLAAISSHESSFRQDLRSDWQQWVDPQTGATSPPWCYCTFGIGQDKVQYHPPYPHTRLSTAWAAELHAMTIRQHYAGLSDAANGPFPTTNNLRRSIYAWYQGQGGTPAGTDGANSQYVCFVIGGTVNEPGQPYHGVTFDPTNAGAAFPSYMALAKWANAGLKNTGYWQY